MVQLMLSGLRDVDSTWLSRSGYVDAPFGSSKGWPATTVSGRPACRRAGCGSLDGEATSRALDDVQLRTVTGQPLQFQLRVVGQRLFDGLAGVPGSESMAGLPADVGRWDSVGPNGPGGQRKHAASAASCSRRWRGTDRCDSPRCRCEGEEVTFIGGEDIEHMLAVPGPTTGRWPLTPSVRHKVGTMGKRASSWLNRTSSPVAAFF